MIYGEAVVSPNSSEALITYLVPPRGGSQLTGVIFWGDSDAEFTIYKNGQCIGGARTSPSHRTVQVFFDSDPIGLAAKDLIQIYGMHSESTPQILKCSALIVQL